LLTFIFIATVGLSGSDRKLWFLLVDFLQPGGYVTYDTNLMRTVNLAAIKRGNE